MTGTVAAPTVGEDRDLRGRTVWIVGINYAPDHVGIAPYTTQLAEHLHRRGARVEVTTGIPHYPEYRVPDGYRRHVSSREHRNGVSVRRLRHTVPRRMTAARRALYEATFLGHVLVRRPPCRPDLVIGVTPALSGAVAAAALGRRLGVPYMVIVQDLVAPGAVQSGISGGARFVAITGRAETWAFRRASAVTILHDGFRPYVLDTGLPPERVHVVRNWAYTARPALTPVQARAALGWPSDRPVVLYAGNMGLKMGLDNVVAAARLAWERDEKILFVLLGDGSQRETLAAAGRDLPTLRFEDSRYGSGFADALGAADVLLVNERPSVRNMSLPSKLAAYFAAGRPVLAAVAEGGTTALEVTQAGAGVVVPPGDPAGLLDAALALAADEARCRELGDAGRSYGAGEYDRDTILRRVEAIIGEIAPQPSPPRRTA